MGLKKDHEIKCTCWWLPLGLHLTLLCWLTATWLLDRFPASLAYKWKWVGDLDLLVV